MADRPESRATHAQEPPGSLPAGQHPRIPRAASERFEDGRVAAASDRRTAAIYLWGYAADMPQAGLFRRGRLWRGVGLSRWSTSLLRW